MHAPNTLRSPGLPNCMAILLVVKEPKCPNFQSTIHSLRVVQDCTHRLPYQIFQWEGLMEGMYIRFYFDLC